MAEIEKPMYYEVNAVTDKTLRKNMTLHEKLFDSKSPLGDLGVIKNGKIKPQENKQH
jgi:hypothetical protein